MEMNNTEMEKQKQEQEQPREEEELEQQQEEVGLISRQSRRRYDSKPTSAEEEGAEVEYGNRNGNYLAAAGGFSEGNGHEEDANISSQKEKSSVYSDNNEDNGSSADEIDVQSIINQDHHHHQNDSGVDLTEEIDQEFTEVEVERVIQRQTTHDLYCPNCHSCITRRVILLRRKPPVRIIPRETKDKVRKRPATGANDQDQCQARDNLSISSNDSPAAHDDTPTPLDIFRCLSCFTIFFPSGNCLKLPWRTNVPNIPSPNDRKPPMDQGDTAPDGSAAPNVDNRAPDGSAAPNVDNGAPDGSAAPNVDNRAPDGSAAPNVDNRAPDGSAAPNVDNRAPDGSAAPNVDNRAPYRSVAPSPLKTIPPEGDVDMPSQGGVQSDLGYDLKIRIGTPPPDSPTSSQNVDPVGTMAGTGTDAGNTGTEAREAHQLDVVKSIVYGGLIEAITSLGVVSSAAASDASTLNILVLGLANLISGLFIIVNNLRELKKDRDQDRYQQVLGRRENFRLHATIVVLSFLIFGLMPPVIYGFSFRKSDDRDLKIVAVAGSSLACIILLAIGKAHVKRPPGTYITTVLQYVAIGFVASGLSYVAGNLIKQLLQQLHLFESPSDVTSVPFPQGNLMKPGWASF